MATSATRLGIAVVATVLMLGYTLSPSLQVGFTSDDSLRSLREGLLLERGADWLQYLVSLNSELMHGAGRFMPVHFLLYTTTWVSDVDTHRALALVLVLVSVLFSGVLVWRVFGSSELAVLAAALLPILIQFRAYHDPILGFGGFIPGVIILNALSLLVLNWAGRTGRPCGYVLSSIIYLLALWTYEISYFLLPLHAIVAHHIGATRKPAFLAALSGALAVASLTTLYARHISSAAYAGTQLGDLGAPFWRTLLVQLSGALPFSYTWAASSETRAATPSIACVLFYLFGYLLVFQTTRNARRPNVGAVLGFAAVLMLGPAIPVAASAKYQHELLWGLAYLPILASIIGLALVAATLIIGAPMNRLTRTALAIAAALAAAWTHAENSATCDRVAQAFARPRAIATHALERGLFAGVADGAGVIVAGRLLLDDIQPGWNWYGWDRPAFFRMHAGMSAAWVLRDGLVRTSDAAEREWSHSWWQTAATSPMYYLQYESFAGGGGRAMIAPVSHDDALGGLRTTGPTRRYEEQPTGAWNMTELRLVGVDPRQQSWFAPAVD